MRNALKRLLLCVLVLSSGAARSEDAVTVDVQVILLAKVFTYNRAFAGKQKQVLVLDEGDASQKAIKAFQQIGVTATLLKPAAPLEAPAEATMVYFTRPHPGLKALCEARSLLSISGDTGNVERGEATLGIRKGAQGRLEIVINLPSAKAEKQDFAAELLGIAKVIR